MRWLSTAAVAGLMISGAALAAVKPNTPTPMPAVKAQMKAKVDKTSTDLFNTAGQADPENGPDQKLPDAAGWAKAKAQAIKCVGNLKQIGLANYMYFSDQNKGVAYDAWPALWMEKLASQYNAIKEVRYSLNGAALDKEIKMPACDKKDPYAIPYDYQPYFKVADSVKSMAVQVTYTDGTKSPVREYKRQ